MESVIHYQPRGALDLRAYGIHLARDGTMQPYSMAAQFQGTPQSPQPMDGRTFALYHVTGPADVHYPAWEMHPEGDELLVLVSGSIAVELRQDESQRTVSLAPESILIVPAGAWHRLIVQEPSVLIAVTKPENTRHTAG